MKKIILGVAFLGFFGFLCGGEAGAASFGANAFDLNQAAATLELGQNRPQYLAQVDTELRGDATDFTFFLQKIIKILVTFAGAVAVILLIINGLILVTAAGEEDRINTAKKGLTWAGAGLVLITFAYLIAKTAIWVTFIAEIGEEKICKDPVPYPCYGDDNNTNDSCTGAGGSIPWGVNPSPAICNAATGNDECTIRTLQEALWEEGMYHKSAGQDYTESQAVDGKYGRKTQKALFELKRTLGCRDSICDEEIPNSCFEDNGGLTSDSAEHCYIKSDDLPNYFKIFESNGEVATNLCFALGIVENSEMDSLSEECTFEKIKTKYLNKPESFEITPWKGGKVPQSICDSIFWELTWSGKEPGIAKLACTLENLQNKLIYYNISFCQENIKSGSFIKKYNYCTEYALNVWYDLQCNGEMYKDPICGVEIPDWCKNADDEKCENFSVGGDGATQSQEVRLPKDWTSQVSLDNINIFFINIPLRVCASITKKENCSMLDIQKKLSENQDSKYGEDTYKALKEKIAKKCVSQ